MMSHIDFTTPSGDAPSGWIGYPTDLGDAWIAWDRGGITRLGLPGMAPPSRSAQDAPGLVTDLIQALQRYFGGIAPLPAVETIGGVPEGTALRRAIYEVVCDIPSGATMTYASIARAVGRPGAARAVGAAMAANRHAPIIPCHRVIGSDGSMRGYAGGIEMKRRLIALEARYA